jgi:hypothetical protein
MIALQSTGLHSRDAKAVPIKIVQRVGARITHIFLPKHHINGKNVVNGRKSSLGICSGLNNAVEASPTGKIVLRVASCQSVLN